MKRYLLPAVLFCLYTYTLQAQEHTIFSCINGTIKFSSEAPLELIKATSDDLIGVLDISKKTFAFKVRIQTFAGFNSALQREHFNENYLESNKFTEAVFSGKIIEDVDLSMDGNYSVRAKGNLNVHGVTQERIIKADVVVKQGKIIIKSAFTVLLSDHDIPIPKVVKDKLSTEIKIDISAQLSPR